VDESAQAPDGADQITGTPCISAERDARSAVSKTILDRRKQRLSISRQISSGEHDRYSLRTALIETRRRKWNCGLDEMCTELRAGSHAGCNRGRSGLADWHYFAHVREARTVSLRGNAPSGLKVVQFVW